VPGELRRSDVGPVRPVELVNAEGNDAFEQLLSGFRRKLAGLGKRAESVFANDDDVLGMNAVIACYTAERAERPAHRIVRIVSDLPRLDCVPQYAFGTAAEPFSRIRLLDHPPHERLDTRVEAICN
jgi:hypothetical protein